MNEPKRLEPVETEPEPIEAVPRDVERPDPDPFFLSEEEHDGWSGIRRRVATDPPPRD